MSEVALAADSKTSVGNGYAHPAEIAGAPIGEAGYLLALVVIAAADFAVFTQIVSEVMQDVDDLLVWAAVVGFTLTSLVLAHSVGRVLRDRAAGYGASGRRVVPLLLSFWLLLGVAGFLARFVVAQTTSEEGAQWLQDMSGATLFLTLYLASGAVAGIGVYFTRNPLRVQYRTTFRAYRKSVNRLARTQAPYQRALSVVELHARGEQRE